MDGEERTAFMGDIMTTHLQVKGVRGVVLDGGVSDAAAIAAIPIPVFCMGNAAIPVTSHRFVIDLNTPVGVAGIPVLPGDVVMGDPNGVCIIPAHTADEIATLALARELLEEFVVGRVREGVPLAGTYPPTRRRLPRLMPGVKQKGGETGTGVEPKAVITQLAQFHAAIRPKPTTPKIRPPMRRIGGTGKECTDQASSRVSNRT
jgi:hypothetical protein